MVVDWGVSGSTEVDGCVDRGLSVGSVIGGEVDSSVPPSGSGVVVHAITIMKGPGVGLCVV